MQQQVRPTNVDGLLRLQADQHGERIAVIDGDSSLTWSELDRHVEAIARGLTELGLVAGHRIAIALENSAEFVACYLASLRGGLVAVPLNPGSRPSEVTRVLNDCGARVCIAGVESIQTVREGVEALHASGAPPSAARSTQGPSSPLVVVVGTPVRAGEIRYDDLSAVGAKVMSPRDPEGLAVLLYTSGTSGRPRAAMLSHRALLANIRQSAATSPPPVQPEDVVLGVLPMFHVYGLNAVLGQVLLTGATLVLARRFDAEETLDLVAREAVTCVPVAPPVLTAWLDTPNAAGRLATVRVLVSGAAPLGEETIRAFETHTGLAVQQGYGLTEAGPVVTSTIGVAGAKPGSAGRALPGVELRIVNEHGNDAEPDDPGEIWVRGQNVFSGYWPEGNGGPGPDGWLHTGDLGYLDHDRELFLVDRLKDLVIVSGFNVYPTEIEEVIAEVPGVAECAVIGAPDPVTGEAVVAFVVPGPEAPPDLATAVAAHCADRLARFKVPVRLEVLAELPYSLTGKVAKGRLRARQSLPEVGQT